MYLAFILPISVVLIFILRVQFPQARKAFQSSLFFLGFALVIQFQNCAGPHSVEVDNGLLEKQVILRSGEPRAM